MYQVNEKFRNAGGSMNLERAMKAGHRARTNALRAGIEVLRTMADRFIQSFRRCRPAYRAHRQAVSDHHRAGLRAS